MNQNIENCEFFTYDTEETSLYVKSEKKCHKFNDNSSSLAFDTANFNSEPSNEDNYQNHFFPTVKFSQSLSGKNILINGGGNESFI